MAQTEVRITVLPPAVAEPRDQASLFPELELCQRCGRPLAELVYGMCPEHWRHLGVNVQ